MLDYEDFKQSILEEVLNEMPKRIGHWLPSELVDSKSNREVYLENKRDKYKKLIKQLADNVILYRSKGTFFIQDDKLEQVTYQMTYKVDKNAKLGQYVWQSTVWNPGGKPYLEGFPRKVIFDYLIPEYGTIVTDSEQSWEGERFWKILIMYAFQRNLNVYYYNFMTKELIKMESFGQWEIFDRDNTYDIWGDSDKHKLKRMLITNKEL
jgi:hypothetical protein